MSTLSVRRPLAVVAVLAMVATMLFAVAGTASAATPALKADFSACPANAGIPDAGFTDVPTGSFFDDEVNCLKYYGVTAGVTTTSYAPADNVTRAQMAVFLARSAAAAGVTLKVSPPDAGFTDIGDLSAEAQLSINQLADVGIVKGKTATTFAPADTVWRQQMALFLTRFLDKATQGPGGEALPATPGTSPFTDLGATTVETSKAINQAWDLGIATGTTDTTFSPLGLVNRGQMALFLTRLFDHTNTRPAGVNIQAKPVTGFGGLTPELSVTHRDASFLPTLNTSIDVFEFTAGTGLTPFHPNGTCDDVQSAATSSTHCTIATGDLTTDANGNLIVINEIVIDGDTVTYYAWTGALAATFNSATTTHSLVAVGSTTGHVDATFKTDVSKFALNHPANPVVKFGRTVTYTVQLVDGATPAKPVAEAGVSFTFRDEKIVDGSAAGTTFTAVKTDASGKATYTVTQADPNKQTPGSDTGSNAVSVEVGPYTPIAAITLHWRDAVPVATEVVAATPTEYKTQSNGASNSATATLYDQYGDTMAGKKINFTSTSALPVVVNEKQTITVDGTFDAGDSFMLTFYSAAHGFEKTAAIAHSAAATLETSVNIVTQLELLIGITGVTVTAAGGGGGTLPLGPWVVEFTGPAGADVALLVGSDYVDAGPTAFTGVTVAETLKGGILASGIGGDPIERTTNSGGVATVGYSWNWGGTTLTGKETIWVRHAAVPVPDDTDFYWVDKAADGAFGAAMTVLVADVDNDTVVGLDAAPTPEAYTSWTWQAGDTFRIGTDLKSQAQFEAAIATTGASVDLPTYVGTGSGFSEFIKTP